MQYNIYFRKAVWDKFHLEEKKSEIINQLLEKHYGVSQPDAYLLSPKVKEVINTNAPDPDLGFPCCQKKVPCKHWSFDGEMGTWANSVTGMTREVTT